MLERATSCLDSGARLSLRCARRAPRSNRQLHSTFWNHGAGDLDLPVWALTTSQPATHSSSEYEKGGKERRHEGGEGGSEGSVVVAVEGPYLDFLYPPPALAFLHRTKERTWERWERRNARRLPGGFVQASRGYASKAKTKAREPLPDFEPEGGVGPLQASNRAISGLDAEDANETKEDEGNELKEYTLDSGEELVTNDGDSFASLPGDLGEEAVESPPTAQGLRNRMAASQRKATRADPAKSLEETDQVWSLYEKLTDEHRSTALKAEVLDWLATHNNEVAETHCLELYSSIPVAQRTVEVYKAALSVFVRCRLFGLAEQGHAEALAQVRKAEELSGWLCKHAIEQEMWDLAFRIKSQLDARHVDSGVVQAVISAGFWRQITDIPNFLDKAISLAKHHRMLYQTHSAPFDIGIFCSTVYKKAIVQELAEPRSEDAEEVSRAKTTFNAQKIRFLLHRVQLIGSDVPEFFRSSIEALVGKDSAIDYKNVHHIVSYMYLQYRKMTGITPDQGLLMQLLRRLTIHFDSMEETHRSATSMTPSTIELDWVKFYGRVSKNALAWLITTWACRGRPDRVSHYFDLLQETYPDFDDQRRSLWPLIYVHARRADVDAAKAALEMVLAMNNAAPRSVSTRERLQWWGILLHAHSRADDLDGALETLQRLGEDGLVPDEYSLHPVMELYASRGDVEGVEELFRQFEAAGQKMATSLYGSLMNANINNGDIDGAINILEKAVTLHGKREISGELTGCFNILLTAYAIRREIDATMRAYRWMKTEGVPLSADTYGALMLSLTLYRQTNAAYRILNKVMRDHGFKPTAFHYAIIMTGFINQRNYKEALDCHRRMKNRNIRPSTSSNVAYLKAKALYEGRQKAGSDDDVAPVSSLGETIRAIRNMIRADIRVPLAVKQPQNVHISDYGTIEAVHFGHLIYAHGKRQCFDAVKVLVHQYRRSVAKGKDDISEQQLPIQVLNALMVTYITAREWDEVDQCWALAKEQADAITPTKPVPKLTSLSEGIEGVELPNLPTLADVNAPAPIPHLATNTTRPASTSNPEKSSALRHILSTATRHYMQSLLLRSRYADMISTAASVLSQGYTFDNRTWNTFIENLLRTSTPLALLAFRLTERYLIPSFPGWATSVRKKPRESARVQGLQYIKARYLRPGVLMAQYRTLVRLGSAVLSLRRMEATGVGIGEVDKELRKYVGTTKMIRKFAPKTLYVVQSMPKIEDRLQREMLRGQKS